MVVAGSGERVSSRFIMPHTCSIGKRSGDLTGQGSCCTHEEHVASQQPYVDVGCYDEESPHLPVTEMAVARG